MDKEWAGHAITLALGARDIILKHYSEPIDVEYKEDDSPLTLADQEANALIVKGLKESFPDHAILSEESEDNLDRLNNEWVWIVDPLDGTKEFIKKNGEFTVNIALTHNGEPVIGVISLPAKNELYWAIKGVGVYSKIDGVTKNLQVSSNKDFSDMIIARSRSHPSEELLRLIQKAKFKDTVVAGSSLKGCLVASGAADTYVRLGNTSEWDICAVDCIVRCAGGKVTDMNGKPLKYNNADILFRGFIMSNGHAHKELLELIKNG